jgi:hypothetical protein
LSGRPSISHDLLALDRAAGRLDLGDGAGGVGHEPVDLDALDDGDTLGLGLAGETLHRLDVEGEAALVLVQRDLEARRTPVGEQLEHVLADVVLAGDQRGGVADLLVATSDLGQVADLALGAEGDVADLVVVVRLGVGLPDLDVGGHQLGHGRLVVVVAHHTAGDARGAGGDARLVDDGDVGTGADAARLELLGEVIPGRQAVDAGADDQVLGGAGDGHDPEPLPVLAIRQQCCRR